MLSHFLRKLRSVAGRQQFEVPMIVVECDGIRWTMTPAGKKVLGNAGPDLKAWLASAETQLIKRNNQRTIHRVELPDQCAVFLKQSRINSPRAWVREVLRPSKCRLEFENTLLLLERGIPTIEPLALGESISRWPGDSYLITREQLGAIPFATFLETHFSALSSQDQLRLRTRIAKKMGRFFAKLHDEGIVHPDPHPGNFLIEFEERLTPKFYLTDVHDIAIRKALNWKESRNNLVLLNRYFQMRATPRDRARFWIAYGDTRQTLSARVEKVTHAYQLEEATFASNLRFWASRIKRHQSDNRDTRRIAGQSVAGFVHTDLTQELVESWLNDPDAAFASENAMILKDSRTSKVALITLSRSHNLQQVIYKRFNTKSGLGSLKNLLRPSPALRSWLAGHGLLDRGLNTPRPLAMFQRYHFGVPGPGYVIFEYVPNSLGLHEAIARSESVPPDQRVERLHAWARQLGIILAQLHDRQVVHRDLKASNILIGINSGNAEAEKPVLIDLVGARLGQPVDFESRIRDLARLNASFVNSESISRTIRLRLLKTYLRTCRDHSQISNWKAWWHRADQATRAKIQQNRDRQRPLS